MSFVGERVARAKQFRKLPEYYIRKSKAVFSEIVSCNGPSLSLSLSVDRIALRQVPRGCHKRWDGLSARLREIAGLKSEQHVGYTWESHATFARSYRYLPVLRRTDLSAASFPRLLVSPLNPPEPEKRKVVRGRRSISMFFSRQRGSAVIIAFAIFPMLARAARTSQLSTRRFINFLRNAQANGQISFQTARDAKFSARRPDGIQYSINIPCSIRCAFVRTFPANWYFRPRQCGKLLDLTSG